jgi:hypothetical protein
VIDLRAVVDIQDVHDAAVLVDPVGDAIGAAPSPVTSGERPVQGLADPVRIDRSAASQNSGAAVATASGSCSAIAGRAAGWKRISYRCPDSLVTRR